MQGELEWLDPDGAAAAEEETLDVGSRWSASSWLARATLWPLRRHSAGRIALAPLALLAVLTLGPSGPGSTSAVHGTVQRPPLIWPCIYTESPDADDAPAARNLRGSLIAEQMQRAPHGTGACPAPGRITPGMNGLNGAARDRFVSAAMPGGRRT